MDTGEILKEVRANRALLKSCRRHTIDPSTYKFGHKLTCIHCGGTISATEYMAYVNGYIAAGGEANDVWPGWEK